MARLREDLVDLVVMILETVVEALELLRKDIREALDLALNNHNIMIILLLERLELERQVSLNQRELVSILILKLRLLVN